MNAPQLLTASWSRFAALSALALATAVSAPAADAKKPDPTGTWAWTVAGRNGGQSRETTMKLKAEGEKLTGTIAGRRRGGDDGAQAADIQIKEGKITGDQISFTVTREFNGNSFTTKYTGKITGDAIKGKITSERNGETRERDWEAKRKPETT